MREFLLDLAAADQLIDLIGLSAGILVLLFLMIKDKISDWVCEYRHSKSMDKKREEILKSIPDGTKGYQQ